MRALSTFKSQICTTDESDEREISQEPPVELFIWTLTHSAPVFTEINPVFKSRRELLDHVVARVDDQQREAGTISHNSADEVMRIAIDKIGSEWRAWVKVHCEFSFDEHRLDDMLMVVLYRFILDRDGRKCVLCQSSDDLTIHHIIQKRRNMRKSAPPFGRSVPTNLITLCRSCHSFFDPLILV